MRSKRGRELVFLGVVVLWGSMGVAETDATDTEARRSALTTEAARELVSKVAPEVERLRGLRFEQPVAVEVVDAAGARAYAQRRLRRFAKQQDLEATGRVYELLGLIPPGTDLVETVLLAVEEQAGGFYDPATRSYYLLDDVPAAAVSVLAAHELTHALEDQAFDLDLRLEQVIADDDRVLAYSAVHEGSATALMSVYAVQAMQRGDLDSGVLQALAGTEAGRAEKLARLPPVLLRQMLGPYLLGVSFLTRGNPLAMAQGFPLEAVEQVYRDGPQSTEQILHPEKFWSAEDRDDPLRVLLGTAGEVLGRRWTLRANGTLGELTLGPLVGAATPFDPSALALSGASAWTHVATDGWGGDRWELWTRRGRAALLFLSAWDSESDALEFAEALPVRASLRWRRSGDRVAIVAGNPGSRADAVLERLLSFGHVERGRAE